ncbi:hypothetical protein B0H19DRAFT_1065485 [Mycena capillaripes]|nr:hypothetical protein B0H19DRAFT_1065485 [Mycena capillaripes]
MGSLFTKKSDVANGQRESDKKSANPDDRGPKIADPIALAWESYADLARVTILLLSDNGTEQSFDRGLFIGIKLTSSFILTFEFVMDEGVDTTPGPPWDTGEENNSSSGPEIKCTTTAEVGLVELQKNWNQSKPSTRSEGKEAATEMPFKNIDRTPASHKSDRRPEVPETGTLQEVAIEVMEGRNKVGDMAIA